MVPAKEANPGSSVPHHVMSGVGELVAALMELSPGATMHPVQDFIVIAED